MVPVISLRLYTKWSKIVKTGGKLESQGFSFFTVVKISTTMKSEGDISWSAIADSYIGFYNKMLKKN